MNASPLTASLAFEPLPQLFQLSDDLRAERFGHLVNRLIRRRNLGAQPSGPRPLALDELTPLVVIHEHRHYVVAGTPNLQSESSGGH
jgi:hypothetical protein